MLGCRLFQEVDRRWSSARIHALEAIKCLRLLPAGLLGVVSTLNQVRSERVRSLQKAGGQFKL